MLHSAAKNDNESCLRQFEHLCRGPSSSSEERLLLDPAGEGEDILNDEWWKKNQQQLTVLTNNAGRRKGAITEIDQVAGVVESSLHENEINNNQQASQ